MELDSDSSSDFFSRLFQTETETAETKRPRLLIVACLLCITKGHSVVPGGTESSQQRGNLCAQFIKNRRSLLVPELIQKGLGAVHTECKDSAGLRAYKSSGQHWEALGAAQSLSFWEKKKFTKQKYFHRKQFQPYKLIWSPYKLIWWSYKLIWWP